MVAAGRTDAGVHAEGQVASFETSSTIPALGLERALRARLPEDVWVIHAEDAPAGFDARRSARRRWYRYAIWRAAAPPAAWVGRCLAMPEPLDVPAMRRATVGLLGRQDFASFVGGWSQQARQRPRRSTRRTLMAADWLGTDDDPLLLFEVCGDAFLRQMVRSLVGSLLWVGGGRWTAGDFLAALEARDRRSAGPAAPAAGLTLWKIEY